MTCAVAVSAVTSTWSCVSVTSRSRFAVGAIGPGASGGAWLSPHAASTMMTTARFISGAARSR
ncbi:MAG: hypothetical protein ACM31C_19805 [Acidobacteriota bacterium]